MDVARIILSTKSLPTGWVFIDFAQRQSHQLLQEKNQQNQVLQFVALQHQSLGDYTQNQQLAQYSRSQKIRCQCCSVHYPFSICCITLHQQQLAWRQAPLLHRSQNWSLIKPVLSRSQTILLTCSTSSYCWSGETTFYRSRCFSSPTRTFT